MKAYSNHDEPPRAMGDIVVGDRTSFSMRVLSRSGGREASTVACGISTTGYWTPVSRIAGAMVASGSCTMCETVEPIGGFGALLPMRTMGSTQRSDHNDLVVPAHVADRARPQVRARREREHKS